jgi:hypothetical protein
LEATLRRLFAFSSIPAHKPLMFFCKIIRNSNNELINQLTTVVMHEKEFYHFSMWLEVKVAEVVNIGG